MMPFLRMDFKRASACFLTEKRFLRSHMKNLVSSFTICHHRDTRRASPSGQ